MTAPTWSYYSESKSFAYVGGTGEVHFYVPDISAVGGSDKMLRKRRATDIFGYGMLSGSSLCQWLWNDVVAIPSLWLWPNFINCGIGPAVDAEIDEGTPYTPENATNPSWPWDRVFVTNPDSRCGDCYCAGCSSGDARAHYRCGNMRTRTSACLYIQEGGAPSGGFPTVGSGYFYWVFKFAASTAVQSMYNRTFIPDVQSEVHEASSYAGTFGIDKVISINLGGEVVGNNAFDEAVPSIVTVMYAKEIDCETDFNGSPVTIPFWEIISPSSTITLVLDTYPSSVEIEFQAKLTGVDTYNSGSGNWESPITGDVDIELNGGGAGGGAGGSGSGSNGGSGGGGGGYCKKTISVTAGQLIPYSVGSGGAGGLDSGTGLGGAGTASTANGTLTANGGDGGDYGDNDPTVSAAGGTATGGDTNTSGGASAAVSSGNHGSAGGSSPNGGTGGAGGIDGSTEVGSAGGAPGAGGGGGAKTEENGGAGAAGRVRFTY